MSWSYFNMVTLHRFPLGNIADVNRVKEVSWGQKMSLFSSCFDSCSQECIHDQRKLETLSISLSRVILSADTIIRNKVPCVCISRVSALPDCICITADLDWCIRPLKWSDAVLTKAVSSTVNTFALTQRTIYPVVKSDWKSNIDRLRGSVFGSNYPSFFLFNCFIVHEMWAQKYTIYLKFRSALEVNESLNIVTRAVSVMLTTLSLFHMITYYS